MDAWGGRLDTMLPPRDRAPSNYAQGAREAERAADVARAAAEAKGEEAARIAQRPPSPDPQAYEAHHAKRQAKANQASRDVAEHWGGMSLGDTLQPNSRRASTHSNVYDRPSSGMASAEYDRRPNDYDRQAFDDFAEAQAPRKAPPMRAPQNDDRFGSGTPDTMDFNDNVEDFHVEVKVPRGSPTGPSSRGYDTQSSLPPELPPQSQRPPPRESLPKARGRQSAASAADDGWGGQSLADAFAPKKAPPQQSGAGGSSFSRAPPPRGITSSNAAWSGNDCKKKPEEIIAWVRTLPESHVPEKSRENIAAIVEDGMLDGNEFTEYVQRIPPEICAPKHAMKLKAAWQNVLGEAAMQEVARQNAMRNNNAQKATMIVV